MVKSGSGSAPDGILKDVKKSLGQLTVAAIGTRPDIWAMAFELTETLDSLAYRHLEMLNILIQYVR